MKIEEMVDVFLNSANFAPHALLTLAPPSSYALNLSNSIDQGAFWNTVCATYGAERLVGLAFLTHQDLHQQNGRNSHVWLQGTTK